MVWVGPTPIGKCSYEKPERRQKQREGGVRRSRVKGPGSLPGMPTASRRAGVFPMPGRECGPPMPWF